MTSCQPICSNCNETESVQILLTFITENLKIHTLQFYTFLFGLCKRSLQRMLTCNLLVLKAHVPLQTSWRKDYICCKGMLSFHFILLQNTCMTSQMTNTITYTPKRKWSFFTWGFLEVNWIKITQFLTY